METIFSNSQETMNAVSEYAITYGLKFLAALIVFLIGKRIARAITSLVTKAMRKRNIDEELVIFIDHLLYSLLFMAVCITALTQLGVQTASFIAVLGAAGLAIGLALQGSLSNFAAGILLIILRPFKSGDWIDAAGESGKVISIKIFTTELRTGDNKCVIVPNARILDSNIVNHSSTGTRRIDMVFGISYEDNIDHARSVIEGVLAQEPRILKEPETIIGIAELADNSVNFMVRPWVKSDDYWNVYRDINEQMKKQFDQQGIAIPYPQRTVHMVQT